MPTTLRTTRCGLDYIHALYDPFSVLGEPCIPGDFPIESQKFRVTSRGTFNVGTQGVGGIAFWPFRGFYSDTFLVNANTNDAVALVATTATYAQTDHSYLNSGSPAVADATISRLHGVTSPYTAVNFKENTRRAIKLVAAGLRVSYCGKVTDMQGEYTVWRNPGVSSAIPGTADTMGDLLAQNSASMLRINEQTVGVTYFPLRADDLAAVYEPGYNTGDGSSKMFTDPLASRLAGGIAINGATAGAPFTYEFIGFYEALGVGLPKTPSHSDPTMISAAVAASAGPVQPNLPLAFKNGLAQIATNALSEAVNVAVPLIQENAVRVAGGAVRATLKHALVPTDRRIR